VHGNVFSLIFNDLLNFFYQIWLQFVRAKLFNQMVVVKSAFCIHALRRKCIISYAKGTAGCLQSCSFALLGSVRTIQFEESVAF